jgi:hypothetical protein
MKLANIWTVTPDSLRDLLKRYSVHDAFTDKAIDEYQKYAQTGKHQDLQFWRDRENWPTEPKSGGSECAK